MSVRKAKTVPEKEKEATPRIYPIVGEETLPPALRPQETALVPYDPLQMYLLEIKQYNLLTREEEKELAIRVREQHDQRAAYRLITANLRLVVKIAMDFHRYWTRNLLDLIQEEIGRAHV